MTRLESLRCIKTIPEFAHLLGYKANSLSFIVYKMDDESKYTEFSIPKKNGSQRVILAPNPKLKLLQSHLANLLMHCYEEINKDRKSLSHGFIKKHSIITNATQHKNKRYVFNIDLQDFFPSINFGRVRGFFIHNRNFQLDEKIATIIAKIACYNNELPQGSPCSPIISNLIGQILDIKIVRIAKKSKVTYSRYADDLTFSTNNSSFSKNIAIINDKGEWEVGPILLDKINTAGFIVNQSKVSMQYKTSRQMTTGLIVNRKVNIKNEYYRETRAMCNMFLKNGDFFIGKEITDEGEVDKLGTINQLNGRLDFIYKIKRDKDEPHGKKKSNPTGIRRVYQSFIFCKNFYINKTPVIITEGKTDIVYLKCALQRLNDLYPKLISKEGPIFQYNIHFFKFTDNIKDVFGIASGTSGMEYIIDYYESQIKEIPQHCLQHPVIIAIDNDKGAKEIKKRIKAKCKTNTIDPFIKYNIAKNLYVLFTTVSEGSEIEDLFDEEILETKIDGKAFIRKNNPDDTKYYGKHLFCEKVIWKKKNEINFSNFKPFLNRLNEVIEAYSSA